MYSKVFRASALALCQLCRALVRATLTSGLLVLALVCALPQHQADALVVSADVKRPLIFIPGLLGSRLCRAAPGNPDPVVVWGKLSALSQFPTLRLQGNRAETDVRPCGLIREIVYLGLFTQEVYAPIIEHLEEIGYQEGKDLFVFDYDWRLSVFDNAELLAAFIRQNVPGETERVDILAHSMGKLVARVYAFKRGEAARIGRLISAGTPFLGSVKVFATLERGWGTMNMLMGGLTAFRQTVLSFPSTFELMPRYGGCCESGAPAAFAPDKVESWLALGWNGIDANSLPNLANVAARQRELQEIVNAGLSGEAEDIMLIGVDQRTPQQFAIELRRGRARLRLKTTWAGDGTVVRDSAVMPRAAVHPTSFSDHEHILDDRQVQEFLRVTLTRGLDEAIRTVRVRPRSRVRTALGKLTELVGVAVVADEPFYGTGQKSTVYVHVRLGEREPLSPQRIRLTVRKPDGTEAPVVLRPDPLASDPTNPFEQSFAGEFDSGTQPGSAIVTAAVLIDDALPRVVRRVVPIVAQ